MNDSRPTTCAERNCTNAVTAYLLEYPSATNARHLSFCDIHAAKWVRNISESMLKSNAAHHRDDVEYVQAFPSHLYFRPGPEPSSVLLKERDGERMCCYQTGYTEASLLYHAILYGGALSPYQPFFALCDFTGWSLVNVVLTGTAYKAPPECHVNLSNGIESQDIAMRPSDGIALSVLAKKPLRVSAALFPLADG